MNKYRYSIIIPHHNIPKLLSRCLESIPERDDLQVVVVDDCSPAADTYLSGIPALNRENVLFLTTQANSGAGCARNVGMSAAEGEYLLFVDADDAVTPELSSILDDHASDCFDVLFFNAESVDSDGHRTDRCHHLDRYIRRASRKDPERGLSELRYAFGEPWCKIVRRDFIEQNGIRFDEVPIHNDTTFSYLVGYHAQSILVDTRKGYRKIDRPEGVSYMRSRELFMSSFEVFFRKARFLADHGIGFEDVSYGYHIREVLSAEDKSLYRDVLVLAQEYGLDETYLSRVRRRYRIKALWNRIGAIMP